MLGFLAIMRARDETIHNAEMEAIKFYLTRGHIKSDVTLYLKIIKDAELEEKRNIQ